MALQNFVDYIGPKISAAWLNGVDRLKFTIFGDAATKAAARAALTQDLPLEPGNGGTGVRTIAELATLIVPFGFQAIVKPTTTTRTSTTTLAADPELTLSVTGVGTYLFDMWVLVSVDTGGGLTTEGVDMKFEAVFSGSFGGPYMFDCTPKDSAQHDGPALFIGVPLIADFDDYAMVRIQGWATMYSASGTITLWWAQNASSSFGVSVQSGSYLRVQKIA